MKEYASVIVRATACADESSEKSYFGNDQKGDGTIVIKWEKSLEDMYLNKKIPAWQLPTWS